MANKKVKDVKAIPAIGKERLTTIDRARTQNIILCYGQACGTHSLGFNVSERKKKLSHLDFVKFTYGIGKNPTRLQLTQ